MGASQDLGTEPGIGQRKVSWENVKPFSYVSRVQNLVSVDVEPG